MIELLSRFNNGELFGFVAMAGGLACGITAIAMGCWLEIRKVALKQDMINRGMTADEIRTVVEAGSHRCRKEVARSHFCRE